MQARRDDGVATEAAGAPFLAGGGTMGAMMRAHDWASTPLGPTDAWPQSLRTIVSTCLNSRFPILVWWGPDFVKLYNDAYMLILAAKHPAALGAPGREVWPEIWHIIGPMLDSVMRDGIATWSEDQFLPLHRHGFAEECYFTFSYSPIRDESGGVGGVFCAVTETTQKVIDARRLRVLQEVAASAGDAKSAADACASAAAVIESDPADLPFALVYLLDGDRPARLAAAANPPDACAPPLVGLEDGGALWPIGRVVAQGEPIEVDLPSSDAMERRVTGRCARACVLPIPGAEGSPIGAFVAGLSPMLAFDEGYRGFTRLVAGHIGTAVSATRALEAERQRAMALAELDRAKTLFFSNVSHEFRTPLTLVLGPIEDALRTAERRIDGDTLTLVHRNALRLLRLVNSLLDFSRIEAGRAQPRFEPTDLGTFTREVASAFEPLMTQAGLQFEIDCRRGEASAYIDRDLWEKLLLNLLSNAFKFTLKGRVGIAVRCGRGGEFEIKVSDTGSGIPEADLPRIFDRFHRVEGGPSRSHEGSGIGLALANQIVQIHGGRIEVRSHVGEGTEFTVRLPAGHAHLPADAVVEAGGARDGSSVAKRYLDEARRWVRAEPDGDVEPRGIVSRGGARVLVADDNADMRDYLSRLLGVLWHVDVAVDGADALARIRTEPPDLVVADVMMPRLDGFALVREMRNDPRLATIPVVVLSARAGEEAVVDGLAAGADDYLVKPFSGRELVARVRTQLELARLRDQAARQHEHLLTLLREAPAAIAVVRGPQHVYEFANHRYRALVGRHEIVGKPGRVALPELEEQGIWRICDQVLASGEAYVAHERPVELARGAGGARELGFFDFVLQPIAGADGRSDAILIHAVETTQAVRSRQLIDDARRDAEAANRAKDDFLAMLGHELRNPLAPIVTALQLMRLRAGDVAAKERAVIERQITHVVRLVDDLLDVSRLTRGKITLNRQPIEIAEVVAKAVETASPLLEEHRHDLVIDVPVEGCLVDGDAGRLAQVVSNLLTNAAKYTPPGGRIRVAAAGEDAEVVLRVADNGIGLSPHMLPRIFDLFAQDHQALDRARGGLGLGLAIVKSFVSLHGGRVSAHSDGVGRGSEFVIRLPRCFAGVEGVVGHATPAPVPPAVVRLHALVVDDNADAAGMLAELLEELGCQVSKARDAIEALGLVDTASIDIAFLDIGLPAMDGYELAQQLRARGCSARLFAVTGYGQRADSERSRAAGFDGHLVKPVAPAAIEAAVAAARLAADADHSR